ncbi:MAG: hypothetical protein OXF52_01925 [Candidatus Dadabacteria bacterium]|nr:hypothetical protein [Candidatus Dadabacteria bacterium]
MPAQWTGADGRNVRVSPCVSVPEQTFLLDIAPAVLILSFGR